MGTPSLPLAAPADRGRKTKRPRTMQLLNGSPLLDSCCGRAYASLPRRINNAKRKDRGGARGIVALPWPRRRGSGTTVVVAVRQTLSASRARGRGRPLATVYHASLL